MHLALTLVAVAVTVIVVARLCEPVGLPAPLALLGVGVVASYLPGIPQLTMSPEVVMVGLLPPLLYAAALGTSLIDVRAQLGPILGLSVGLVLFTAAGVALLVTWLLPVGFAVGLAVGAIVAPPDAVATTAVARRIGLPRRITTILEGESLLNDATALVTLRTALAAAGLASAHAAAGPVEALDVVRDFGWAVVGGVGIGWAVFIVLGVVRKHLTEPTADTALSFAVPFVAYVPAEAVHASGVLAVVTAGLLLAHRSVALQDAASRLSERTNWSSITFLLENAVFLLIGLQMRWIVEAVDADSLTVGRAVGVAVAVLVAVLLLRPLWVVPYAWLGLWREGRRGGTADRSAQMRVDRAARMRGALIGSWAGMRGVVTLAAALTLPESTPHRPVLVLTALVVTVGTLAVQGFSLPWLARRLQVSGPDPREDALQEATVLQATTAAGLAAVEALPDADPAVVAALRTQSQARVNRVWERLGTGGDLTSETPSETYRRLRLAMIGAERVKLGAIRGRGQVDQQVLADVQRALDAEEAALLWSAARRGRLTSALLTAPHQVSRNCDHLAAEPESAVPASTGCTWCERDGTTPVHLRLCTRCGFVGCCDSSVGKHATAHFEQTGHPVMRSLEPGEAWRWCYVDEVLG